MAVELMGAKLVAPFYGNSLYVLTAVLTITVLGLTLGYYTGGRLAERGASETTLFVVLQISAVLVLALPLTASIAIALTRGRNLIAGICVTCILLLLPPMFCFGIVGPMVVSLMSSRLETVGKTAGTVYFTSTLAGIAATFFLGLYFIPVAGLRWCATVTGLALAVLPVVYLAKRAFGWSSVAGIGDAGSKEFARKRGPGSTIPATAIGVGDAGSKEPRDFRASAAADAAVGVSQSGAAGTPATQTGSPKGELRGRERVKRPTIPTSFQSLSRARGVFRADGSMQFVVLLPPAEQLGSQTKRLPQCSWRRRSAPRSCCRRRFRYGPQCLPAPPLQRVRPRVRYLICRSAPR